MTCPRHTIDASLSVIYTGDRDRRVQWRASKRQTFSVEFYLHGMTNLASLQSVHLKKRSSNVAHRIFEPGTHGMKNVSISSKPNFSVFINLCLRQTFSHFITSHVGPIYIVSG